MPANPLLFKDAEEARDAITKAQQIQIASLYEKWAKEIGKKAEEYAHKTTPSSVVMQRQLEELKKMVEKAGKETAEAVQQNIQTNMYTTANTLIESNADWLTSLGFNAGGVDAAFGNVPKTIVQNLVTGNVYKGGWNLSKAIWGDNERTLQDIYEVVAAGTAQNMSTYDIAKLLEQYVSPSSKKPWNLKAPDGKWIYKKQVDYNAQRLARTLIQHTYQQTFQAVTKENPFVKDYIWNSNGSRVCELCKARDGKHFPKDKLPLDHPNGMCTMVPNTDSMSDISNQLADWAKGKEDPKIDKFAEKLGYKPAVQQQAFTPEQEKYLKKYGYTPDNMPKSYDEWFNKLGMVDMIDILEANGDKLGSVTSADTLMEYYKKLISAKPVAVSKPQLKSMTTGADFVAKYGTSSGAKFNYWYSKLPQEAKDAAKALKDESGQTWQQWYEQNVYKPKAGVVTKKPKVVKKATGAQAGGGMDATKGWISKLKKQTESHMLSLEAKAFAKMTDSQVNGLKAYTGNAYQSMNAYLRYKASGYSDSMAETAARLNMIEKLQLKNAIAGLETTSTEQELILRRGTDLGDLAGLMQGNFADNKEKLKNMSVKELNEMFAGHVGTYAGFTSTSSDWNKGFDGSVEVIMHAPAGTHGTSVMSISQYGTDEGEFLLNAGTRVQVVKVEESDGHVGSRIRVYMEILPK